MAKRCFIVVMTFMIALQSVAPFAAEHLQHATMHHHGPAQHSAHIENENQASRPAAGHSHQASDHCHHSHSCFQMVLAGALTDIGDLATDIALTDYQANLTPGIQSPLFRPPIS